LDGSKASLDDLQLHNSFVDRLLWDVYENGWITGRIVGLLQLASRFLQILHRASRTFVLLEDILDLVVREYGVPFHKKLSNRESCRLRWGIRVCSDRSLFLFDIRLLARQRRLFRLPLRRLCSRTEWSLHQAEHRAAHQHNQTPPFASCHARSLF